MRELKSLSELKGISIVEFGATWCPPCKALLPVMEAISTKYPTISIYKVDIGEQLDMAVKFNILNVPVLLVFRDQQEIDRVIGYGGPEAVEQLFKKHA